MPRCDEEDQQFSVVISKELLFFWIFLIIIFSWLLIDLWGRWVNNFTFVTLNLDEKSPSHTFFIALIATIVIIVMIIYLKSSGTNIEPDVSSTFSSDSGNESSINRDLRDMQRYGVSTIGQTRMFEHL